MTFSYKNQQYTFPASLEEITLAQRINFYNQYGKALNDQMVTIQALPDAFDRELETNCWQLEYAARIFSFFTGIDFEEVKVQIPVEGLLYIYTTDVQELNRQEISIDPQTSYTWQGIQWQLNSPELLKRDFLTMNEYDTVTGLLKQIYYTGKGQWETYPVLCAAYLRKEGEPFSAELVADGSERLALMLTLPLSIALAVGKLLSEIVNAHNSITGKENEHS